MGQRIDKSKTLLAASTLSWIWGILMVVSSLALGIPHLYLGGDLAYPILLLILGMLLCFSGYGLRKKRRVSGIIALAASFTYIFSLFCYGKLDS